jgi:hypothetical protein
MTVCAEDTLDRVMELMHQVMEHAPPSDERYRDEEHRLFHGYLQCIDQELQEYRTREGMDQVMEDEHEALTFDTPDNPNASMRFNSGKPQLSMVLSARPALEGIAKVLEFGAQKYDRDNWKKGLDPDSVLDSMLRHITKYLDGEYLDDESGLPHIDHIGCNALFLGYHTDRETGDGRLDVDVYGVETDFDTLMQMAEDSALFEKETGEYDGNLGPLNNTLNDLAFD